MPSQAVLRAFGAVGEPTPLEGGTGRSWRVGDLVLKPLDCSPGQILWQAEIFESVREDGFRISRPLPAVVDGWTAWGYLDGRHEPQRWNDIIAVGERLHAALVGIPRPSALLDPGVEPWATGDRVAWGEARYPGIDDLVAALRPVDAPSQLIHGDLTGNVLFHEHLPPAVIDFSPYWRPTEYASAIVVGDALIWEGADPSLAELVSPQFLLRALIYRTVTSMLSGADGHPELDLARRIAARCV
jgi:uncharacterized protein (TIGR02569 family)